MSTITPCTSTLRLAITAASLEKFALEIRGLWKTYGNGRGLDSPNAITCTQHIEETVPGEGTFVADGFVIAIPVR